MKIEDLDVKINEFVSTQDKIQQNRQIWTDQKKILLNEILNKIADRYKIGWYVQILEDAKNSEGVNITFKPNNSGILRESAKSKRYYLKMGGTLAFSQAYNGDIFVIILYPFVEEFVSESENKVIGRFNPNDIDEGFIVDKVLTFIDEIIKWEKSVTNNKIGFRVD